MGDNNLVEFPAPPPRRPKTRKSRIEGTLTQADITDRARRVPQHTIGATLLLQVADTQNLLSEHLLNPSSATTNANVAALTANCISMLVLFSRWMELYQIILDPEAPVGTRAPPECRKIQRSSREIKVIARYHRHGR
jgi:hypothetical protein